MAKFGLAALGCYAIHAGFHVLLSISQTTRNASPRNRQALTLPRGVASEHVAHLIQKVAVV